MAVTVMEIRQKRIYDPPAPDDGFRVLIDGLWPRGVSHERAALDLWARELAPSDDLRRWYGHEPGRFQEFDRRYRAELAAHREQLTELRRRARAGRVTIVFGARDAEHSNATVLTDVLRRGLRLRPYAATSGRSSPARTSSTVRERSRPLGSAT